MVGEGRVDRTVSERKDTRARLQLGRLKRAQALLRSDSARVDRGTHPRGDLLHHLRRHAERGGNTVRGHVAARRCPSRRAGARDGLCRAMRREGTVGAKPQISCLFLTLDRAGADLASDAGGAVKPSLPLTLEAFRRRHDCSFLLTLERSDRLAWATAASSVLCVHFLWLRPRWPLAASWPPGPPL